MPVARTERRDRTTPPRLHPPGDRAHHRLAVPEKRGGDDGGDHVTAQHEQIGGGDRGDRAEGCQIEVMLVPGEHGRAGRGAEELEHDVERRLADQHGGGDPKS